MKKSIISRGFTLIELLVVIAIIAILTGIVTANMGDAKKSARDVKRVSDIGNVQLALEMFFDRCRAYPEMLASTRMPNPDSSCGTVKFSDFMSVIPSAPGVDSNDIYQYSVEEGTYVLAARLERNSDVMKDSLTGTHLSVNCGVLSGPTPIYQYCIGPK